MATNHIVQSVVSYDVTGAAYFTEIDTIFTSTIGTDTRRRKTKIAKSIESTIRQEWEGEVFFSSFSSLYNSCVFFTVL